MKILIVCDPGEGRATELSLFLKCEAERMNRRVVVLNALDKSRSIGIFDAVVIVGEINRKYFGDPIVQFIRTHHQELNEIPAFFLTVLECEDENNLKVPENVYSIVKDFINVLQWKAQQAMVVPIGTRLQNNEFITLTDWPELKIALQRFLIKNDLMMTN
jgi:menaquinone-dependent protoporphyrinogen IX oxidase